MGLFSQVLRLYTIGHSNRSPDELIAHLRQHQITVLVDVRSAPYSRYVPHFNKKPLHALLHEHDIKYSFAGEKLDGRPQDAAAYHSDDVPDDETGRAKFLKLVDYVAMMQQGDYRTAIQRLLAIMHETSESGGNVAIMCSEGDPRQCHRHHLIARSLLDPDQQLRAVEIPLTVQHILRDGTLKSPVSPAEFDIPRQQKLF